MESYGNQNEIPMQQKFQASWLPGFLASNIYRTCIEHRMKTINKRNDQRSIENHMKPETENPNIE